MKDFNIKNTQRSINNMSENNSQTNTKSTSSQIRTPDLSSFSSYLQKLCEVVEYDRKIKSPGSSTYEISPAEIQQSLSSAFKFLRERSPEEKMEFKSKCAPRHIRVGNCLTVFSNLEVAPIQKPFKKTVSEELPVGIQNIISTDPSLGNLLKYGCISISTIKNEDSRSSDNSNETPNNYFLNNSSTSTTTKRLNYTGKLLRFKKDATNTTFKKAIDGGQVDVKKFFPEVFVTVSATNTTSKPKYRRSDTIFSSNSRGVTISNVAKFLSNKTEESQYEGNIYPSDLLEVCIEEEEAKETDRAIGNLSDVQCKICKESFGTPIEMYFHVLGHSRNNGITIAKITGKGGSHTHPFKTEVRPRKLKSILKDINYNEEILKDHVDAQSSSSSCSTTSQLTSVPNVVTQKQYYSRKTIPSHFTAQKRVGLRNKLILKSSCRLKLHRLMKAKIRNAIRIVYRNKN